MRRFSWKLEILLDQIDHVFSMNANYKDEKFLIFFQRKTNDYTVRLGTKGKRPLNSDISMSKSERIS